MNFNTQITLENDKTRLSPLQEYDFEDVYGVASDPKIWEQHPNKDRWKREVFKGFFEGALLSKGAFKIIDKKTGTTVGCTRFYDYDEKENSILIGYTFFAINSWGKGTNHEVKTIMLDYAFQYVSKVIFHIGATNYRSQVSIKRLGAIEVAELEVAYFAEEPKLNKVFSISKEQWETFKNTKA